MHYHCCKVVVFLQYKYQINIDGTVAAYRLPYLLIGDSVVIKQDSEYYEHFYHQLEAYEHYIPMRHDLDDIIELVQWAIDHDDTVSVVIKDLLNHFFNTFRPRKLVEVVRSLLRIIYYQKVFIATLCPY